MDKDSLKLAIGSNNLDVIFDELAENYVNGKDDYVLRASGMERMVDPQIINERIIAIKKSDLSTFKKTVKDNFFHYSIAAFNIINECIKDNNLKNLELLVQFDNKIFRNTTIEINDEIQNSPMEFFKIQNEELNAVINLGNELISSKRLADAKLIFEFLKFINPKSYDVWKDLGCVNLQLDYLNEALEAFYHAHEIDPKGPQAYLGILEVYLLQNKLNDARVLFKSFYERLSVDVDKKIKSDLKHFKKLKRGSTL